MIVEIFEQIKINISGSKKQYSKRFFLFTLIFVFNFLNIYCYGFDYKQWWENWYSRGGNSGPGSVGILAQYKADVINDYIDKHKINSVVEFGCGDGVVLQLTKYKDYLGFDVSRTAIKLCTSKFKNDPTKSFFLYEPQFFVNKTIKSVDLVVCLDVLYHVIDEAEYLKVLEDIFSFSSKHIILYTSLNKSTIPYKNPEILHRDILPYLEKYKNYEIAIVPQKYKKLSGADFIFLTKKT